MTDEEIKKAAWDVNNYPDKALCTSRAEGFIVGAKFHRDHDITVRSDNKKVIENLQAEVARLKNPWISVFEQLPKRKKEKEGWSERVVIVTSIGEMCSAMYDHCEGEWFTDTRCVGRVMYWQKPELPEL